MPSLWTDDDRSAHPWVAARSHAAAPTAAPAPILEEPAERRVARPALIAAACACAAIAAALVEVLR